MDYSHSIRILVNPLWTRYRILCRLLPCADHNSATSSRARYCNYSATTLWKHRLPLRGLIKVNSIRVHVPIIPLHFNTRIVTNFRWLFLRMGRGRSDRFWRAMARNHHIRRIELEPSLSLSILISPLRSAGQSYAL